MRDVIVRASRVNPSIYFAVFINKVDGEMFMSEEVRADCQRTVQQRVMEELADMRVEVPMGFYLTSIFDHSVFEAFSKVVQTLVPHMSTLENLMNGLIEVRVRLLPWAPHARARGVGRMLAGSHALCGAYPIQKCAMEKAFIFDVVSKLYLATDSSPVDAHSFELCSDMLDVVIDVSCIYGCAPAGSCATRVPRWQANPAHLRPPPAPRTACKTTLTHWHSTTTQALSSG